MNTLRPIKITIENQPLGCEELLVQIFNFVDGERQQETLTGKLRASTIKHNL